METPQERARRRQEEADAQARSRAARKLAQLQKKVKKAQEAEAQVQPPKPAVIKQPVVKQTEKDKIQGIIDDISAVLAKLPVRVEIERKKDDKPND